MDDQATRRRALLGLSAAGFGLVSIGLGPRALVAADRQQPESRKIAPLPGEVVAEVTLPARRFASGEKIPFAFKITNNSPRTVTLWSSGFWPNHLVEVRDAAGRLLPATPEGQLRSRSFAPGGPRRKNAPIKLGPGESWPKLKGGEDPARRTEFDDSFGLDGLFEFQAGTFTVRVTYHDDSPPTPLKLLSREVKFEVIPAKAD